jgi:hypothetical protein
MLSVPRHDTRQRERAETVREDAQQYGEQYGPRQIRRLFELKGDCVLVSFEVQLIDGDQREDNSPDAFWPIPTDTRLMMRLYRQQCQNDKMINNAFPFVRRTCDLQSSPVNSSETAIVHMRSGNNTANAMTNHCHRNPVLKAATTNCPARYHVT